MTGLSYVYAVCHPFEGPSLSRLTALGGTSPTLLHHCRLAAVVSTVPKADFSEQALKARLEDLDWLSSTARAHQAVIDALVKVTTPLPLRFATVFWDSSGVRSMIEERQDDFRRTLNRLEGRVEWGVKLYLDTEPASDLAERPANGRDYLRRRRASTHAHDERWQLAEVFAQSLHERLCRYAENSRLYAPQGSALSTEPGRNVLNAAYLVPRAHSEDFVDQVDRTKDEAPGIRVEVTGPWAPYSFTGEAVL
ncbi:gas vesicle protein [Streptomyces broussonetiae]|uniref:Gas vesicle protein n=1 Tax=Streptomyces broussonetiae TaxID=2686304 RepID=A0A6I6NFK7_9ACTN|nr:GvpL/GvpF family gas vesicle protein [Streptomyces broussonetiae]QHA09121.1 gas vesicle protein [Streptomyces broussonetiae]